MLSSVLLMAITAATLTILLRINIYEPKYVTSFASFIQCLFTSTFVLNVMSISPLVTQFVIQDPFRVAFLNNENKHLLLSSSILSCILINCFLSLIINHILMPVVVSYLPKLTDTKSTNLGNSCIKSTKQSQLITFQRNQLGTISF